MSVQLLLIDDDTSVSSGITQAPRLHERTPPPPPDFATFMPGSSSLQFNSHAYGKMLIYVHFN